MYTAKGPSTFRTMTRFAPVFIATFLAFVAVAGGASPASGPDAAAKPAPRAGRVLSLNDAIRELDLIRPSRQKIAEDFTLKTTGGGSFRLSDHRGKPVLVNFWATWCAPCKEEMPAMERLYQRHRARGLVLVAISLDANPSVVPAYVKESKLTFAVALDPKAEVANKYGVRALPSSFVIDRHGTMTALALGPRVWDNDASHSLVEALTVDGQGPSRSTTVDGQGPSRSTR
jgi:peroxiredoxin